MMMCLRSVNCEHVQLGVDFAICLPSSFSCTGLIRAYSFTLCQVCRASKQVDKHLKGC